MSNWFNLTDRRKAFETEAAAQGRVFVHKTYGGDKVELKPAGSDFIATVCTDDPDDDREVVQPSLLDLTRFRKTLSVHFEHNLEGFPLGKCKWIKLDDSGHSLTAKYFVSQATPEHRAIDFMLREGVLHQHSVSFINDRAVAPTEKDLQQRPAWKGLKVYKGRGLMIEFSPTGQPANANCDMIAIGKRFGHAVVDRLVGKTAATEAAIEEVVADIPPATRTEAETRKLIGKRLERVIGNVDHDAIVRRAIARLGT